MANLEGVGTPITYSEDNPIQRHIKPTFRRSAEAFSVNFKYCRPTAVGRQ